MYNSSYICSAIGIDGNQKPSVMQLFSVFYLSGGYANFVCKSVYGQFSFENAQKKVIELQKMGFKSMVVKDGHIVGGFLSFSDFQNEFEAKEYYYSI